MRELFATPPDGFVAARNAMAKALRIEKRGEEATAVAALRRPGWDDWALNVVATEQADAVSSFADSAVAVREAQAAAIEGRDGPDVRSSLRDLRDRVGELVALAVEVLGRVGREPGAGELAGRLAEVAAGEAAVEQLRGGVLGSGDDAGDDLFEGLVPAPKRPSKRPAPKKPAAASAPVAGPDPAGRAARRAELKRRREAVTTATRDQRVAAKAASTAERRVESARDDLGRAEAALHAAEAARDEAAATLAGAAADVTRAEAGLDGLDDA